jgi:hypothetical protein
VLPRPSPLGRKSGRAGFLAIPFASARLRYPNAVFSELTKKIPRAGSFSDLKPSSLPHGSLCGAVPHGPSSYHAQYRFAVCTTYLSS